MAMETVSLKPWTTPNFAQFDMPRGKRQEGFKELPSIAVSDLSQAALDDLARQWLAELYHKAGKRNDWTTISPENAP